MLVAAVMLPDSDAVLLQAMKARGGQLDEAFLSHTHACMRKAADDGLNGGHELLDCIGMLACWSYVLILPEEMPQHGSSPAALIEVNAI